MKFDLYSRLGLTLICLGLLLSVAPRPAFGQEGSEPVVIDEVVAQVNDNVVTLSMVKRAIKEAIEERKQQGMTDQQASDEITKHKPELIALLVDDQLLMQKAKDLSFTDEIEAEVNKRMLAVAQQQGIKTMQGLDDAMRAAGIDPAGIRQTLRVEITRQMVLSREVDAKIFYGLTPAETKSYFEAHKDRFTKPESVTLSEIFLSLAGKPEGDVRARAAKLVEQARAGADFAKLAAANSERQQDGQMVGPQTGGKVGTFEVPNLRADIAAAIKNIAAGGVSDPLRSDEGYQIIRVDARSAASNVPTFNEDQVREAITAERSEKERTAYMQKLRRDAYIEVASGYSATVKPLLSTGPATAGIPAATATPANAPAPNALNGKKKSDKNKQP